MVACFGGKIIKLHRVLHTVDGSDVRIAITMDSGMVCLASHSPQPAQVWHWRGAGLAAVTGTGCLGMAGATGGLTDAQAKAKLGCLDRCYITIVSPLKILLKTGVAQVSD